MFQPSTTLSFTASSPAGVTNVTVQLTVTSMYTGNSFLKNLNSKNGLTITGPSTGESVSAVLASNTLYSAVIQVQDATGNTVNQTVVFDTITPVYTWEAEDWDYTSNGVSGLFIDNPQTNGYAGLDTTAGVDAQNSNGNASTYRPGNTENGHGGLYTETTGSPESNYKRLSYIGTGKTDYDVGFTDPGDFGNYTRHYPAGTYNLFVRAAGGNGPKVNSGNISVQSGTASITGLAAGPYKFGVKGNGWQNYDFMPVTDSGGNLITITFDGSQSTINVLQGSDASDNMNFFMLMPINTNEAATTVTITNLYPDGTLQFQWTNVLSFTAHSAAGISPTDVSIQLTGTNLYGVGYSSNLTTANGLTVIGTSTDITVTTPLTSNEVYSAFIQVNDGNGIPATKAVSFDTINPIYTFEAEDYNYSDGTFVDNPQTNAYNGVSGDPGVDYFVDDPLSGSHSYRDNDPTVGGPATEGCGDVPRAAYTNGAPDYDVGFNDSANWENYTRDFPAGTYNIFVRGANGGGGTGSAGMALVTSAANTSSQTVSNLGTFAIPSTGNWQKYILAPLKDKSGNIVNVTFSGTSNTTLRVTSPNSMNGNYYMLAPASTSAIQVGNLYPDGSALFQGTNTLSFSAGSPGGIATSNIVVTLNGTTLSNLTFTGSSTAWTVSYPHLQSNQTYSVTIAIASVSGGIYNLAYTFDTYSANYYQWEASDYDYTSNGVSGLFFDNPQTNAYNGLTATPNVDQLEVTAGTPLNEDLYRPSPDGSTPIVTTQSGGDLFRAKFAVLPSWRINWFGFGDFVNFTRHYPAGTYNIVGRFTEGGSASSALLLKIKSGTTNVLGTFNIPLNGWNGWEFATLVDGSGKPVSVTLDGSQTILQLTGPAADDGQTINAGFFMLVPSAPPGIMITPSISGTQIKLSFPTTTGSNYQVEYKNNLSDVGWTTLGSPLPGNNAVQSVQDSITSHRFYHVHVQ